MKFDAFDMEYPDLTLRENIRLSRASKAKLEAFKQCIRDAKESGAKASHPQTADDILKWMAEHRITVHYSPENFEFQSKAGDNHHASFKEGFELCFRKYVVQEYFDTRYPQKKPTRTPPGCVTIGTSEFAPYPVKSAVVKLG